MTERVPKESIVLFTRKQHFECQRRVHSCAHKCYTGPKCAACTGSVAACIGSMRHTRVSPFLQECPWHQACTMAPRVRHSVAPRVRHRTKSAPHSHQECALDQVCTMVQTNATLAPRVRHSGAGHRYTRLSTVCTLYGPDPSVHSVRR